MKLVDDGDVGSGFLPLLTSRTANATASAATKTTVMNSSRRNHSWRNWGKFSATDTTRLGIRISATTNIGLGIVGMRSKVVLLVAISISAFQPTARMMINITTTDQSVLN